MCPAGQDLAPQKENRSVAALTVLDVLHVQMNTRHQDPHCLGTLVVQHFHNLGETERGGKRERERERDGEREQEREAQN